MVSNVNSFDRNEYRLLATCLVGAALLGFCLAADITFFSKSLSARRGSERLATVDNLTNTVKHSPSHLPVWNRSFIDQTLYRRDKVFTDQTSGAKIRFINGSLIELGESSLVVIDSVEGVPGINILMGTVTTKISGSTARFKIFSQGQEIKMRGQDTSVKLEVKDGRGVVHALSREVTLDLPGGALTLQAGQSFPASETKEQEEEKISLTNLDSTAKLRTKTVTLNSTKTLPKLTARPLASKRTSAKPPVLNPVKMKQPDSVPNVNSHKRARVKTAKKTLAAPSLLYPARKKIVDIADPKLEWRSVDNSLSYQVEIYSYKDPKKIIFSLNALTTRAERPRLKPGKYLWRVASVSSDGVKSYSHKHPFVIKNTNKMKALEALQPDPYDRLSSTKIARIVDFAWHEDKIAAFYRIEVSLSPDFLTTFFSRDIDQPKTSFNFPKGRYYWRISSYDKQKKLIKQSDTRAFNIVATLGRPDFFGDMSVSHRASSQTKAADIDLVWTVIPEADRYDVEVASDANFNDRVLLTTTLEPRVTPTLSLGKHFARVRAIDSYGNASGWSEIKTITVGRTSLPSGPKLILPKAGANFAFRRDSVPISFRWQARGQDESFEIHLAKDSKFEDVVIRKKTPTNVVVLNLKEGSYYWRVRRTHKSQSDWSESRRAHVGKEQASVLLTYPTEKTEVFTDKPLSAKVSFTWQAPKDLTQFKVVVAKDKNFTEILASKTVRGRRVAALDLAHKGQAYWLVEGTNINEALTVRSDAEIFELVPAKQPSWDQVAVARFGARPTQARYSVGESSYRSNVLSGIFAAKYWINRSFGLQFFVSSGKETIANTANQSTSYQANDMSFHLLARNNFNQSSTKHFSLIAAAGLKTSVIPVFALTDESIEFTRESTVRFYSLGLGLSRALNENWLAELFGHYEFTLGDASAISGASMFSIFINLQQKLIDNWHLGYSVQHNSLSYNAETDEQDTKKAANSLELSFGKGF